MQILREILNNAIGLVLWFLGLIANLFIATSILIQMRLQSGQQTANVLMAGNSLNNLLLGFFIFAVILALNLNVCPNNSFLSGLLFAWEMFSVLQMWSITLICVFYCLKIVPGKSGPSAWLRSNFPIVAALIIGVGFAFSLALAVINAFRETPKNGTHRWFNRTCPLIRLPERLVLLKVCTSSVLHSILFCLATYSCAALVVHLYRHVTRMRGNQPDVGGAKQQGVAWVGVMIFLLAVEFVSCSIARHVLVIRFNDEISSRLISDISVVSLALCSLVPITLIAGTSSLRAQVISCFKVLCKATHPHPHP